MNSLKTKERKWSWEECTECCFRKICMPLIFFFKSFGVEKLPTGIRIMVQIRLSKLQLILKFQNQSIVKRYVQCSNFFNLCTLSAFAQLLQRGKTLALRGQVVLLK